MRVTASASKSKKNFQSLRRKYLAAKKKADDYDQSLRSKYGSRYKTYSHRLSTKEQLTIGQLEEKAWRMSSSFFDYLDTISPRDWRSGVPAQWILEELSFDDAVRPKDEDLSVAPPMAWGATGRMR